MTAPLDLLMYRGGIRKIVKKLADGNEHPLYFKARTPVELGAHYGAMTGLQAQDEATGAERQKYLARFIAASMCQEDGSPWLTEKQAIDIVGTLKVELANEICIGSNENGVEAGKD